MPTNIPYGWILFDSLADALYTVESAVYKDANDRETTAQNYRI